MKRKYKDQLLPFEDNNPNKDKIILDLCGGTGAWSQPYRDAGYDVRVITFPAYDLFETIIEDMAVSGRIKFYNSITEIWETIDVKKVVGILFAPSCTQFSLARTTAKTPRDLLEGFRLVQKGLDIIHNVRQYGGNLKFWALENPLGYLRQMLGKPPLTFDPCDYGDTYTKKTDLWGYYEMPRKKPAVLTDDAKARCAINNRELPLIPKDYIMPQDIRPQAVRRSITSSYFANAFFKANKV